MYITYIYIIYVYIYVYTYYIYTYIYIYIHIIYIYIIYILLYIYIYIYSNSPLLDGNSCCCVGPSSGNASRFFLASLVCRLFKTRWSPRTRMLTRMLMVQMSIHMVMVQMSIHMVMQSRTIPFCNSLFEQSCTCSLVTSLQCGVESVVCGVWSVK